MPTKQKPSNAEEIKPEDVLALAARDFACFCVAMHVGFELAKHSRFLIDRLEAVERGQAGLRRLITSSTAAALDPAQAWQDDAAGAVHLLVSRQASKP